jgi:hypothetical protein
MEHTMQAVAKDQIILDSFLTTMGLLKAMVSQ